MSPFSLRGENVFGKIRILVLNLFRASNFEFSPNPPISLISSFREVHLRIDLAIG